MAVNLEYSVVISRLNFPIMPFSFRQQTSSSWVPSLDWYGASVIPVSISSSHSEMNHPGLLNVVEPDGWTSTVLVVTNVQDLSPRPELGDLGVKRHVVALSVGDFSNHASFSESKRVPLLVQDSSISVSPVRWNFRCISAHWSWRESATCMFSIAAGNVVPFGVACVFCAMLTFSSVVWLATVPVLEGNSLTICPSPSALRTFVSESNPATASAHLRSEVLLIFCAGDRGEVPSFSFLLTLSNG